MLKPSETGAEPFEAERWAPPEAPLDMPVQPLQPSAQRGFGLRLPAFLFPSDA